MTEPESAVPARPRRRVQGPPGVQCPSCHKLAGLDEPEVESIDVSSDGEEVTVTATIIRNSTCCGDEIKRADLEGSFPATHDCPNADIVGRTVRIDGEDHEIESGLEDEVEGEDNLEAYTSGGGRYAKTMVGVQGSLTGTCKACGEGVEIEVSGLEIAAGDMDVSV